MPDNVIVEEKYGNVTYLSETICQPTPVETKLGSTIVSVLSIALLNIASIKAFATVVVTDLLELYFTVAFKLPNSFNVVAVEVLFDGMVILLEPK